MAPRGSRTTPALVGACTLAVGCKLLTDVSSSAFVLGPQHLLSHARPTATLQQGKVAASFADATTSNLAGVSVGAMSALGVVVAACREQARSRVAARVVKGAPSLLQVLEQKKLLSLAEGVKLLSQAESAGLNIQTVEQLGLLKFAEKNKLLSTVENLVTNPQTPILWGIGSLFLGVDALYLATQEQVDFFTWVLIGALGAPALVLAIGALVIFSLTSGTSKLRTFSRLESITTYTPDAKLGKFNVTEAFRDATLLQTLEDRGILSFIEENRLLTLAGSLVNKPLTLTQSLGVLSTLEGTRLLSGIESAAADNWGPFNISFAGLVLVPLALALLLLNPFGFGLPLALAIAAPGLLLIAVGIGVSAISPPLPNKQ